MADQSALQLAEGSAEIGPRWRFRGMTPGPDAWSQATWQGSLARFLVISRRSEHPVGMVAAHGASLGDGHAQVSAVRLTEDERSPLLILGMALFIDYVFACWDLRKLYMEVPEFNLDQFSSGIGRVFELEGRLRAHSWLAGRHWDHCFLAIYRERWAEAAGPILELERGR